jgi:hypothetical protein
VTGSSLPDFSMTSGPKNPNIFRIEGPTGLLFETTDFSLMGRVFEGVVGGHVKVDRASYVRNPAGSIKLDVFATAQPSTQMRVPAGPPPAVVIPHLDYHPLPCVPTVGPNGIPGPPYSAPGGVPIQMLGVGANYWGQNEPLTLPLEVCVVQANAVNAGGGTFSAFFPTLVQDQITITQAFYDPPNSTLSVQAASGDQMTPPTLTAVGFGDLTAGSLVITGLVAPPARVRVTSGAFGANEIEVTTGAGATGGGSPIPIAANDAVTVAEDSGATIIPVLANDTVGGSSIPALSIVTLTAPPLMGTAVLNGDGTFSYTPNANRFGADSFTYTVAVNGHLSNPANVAVTITPVNDAPVAFNETLNAFAGLTAALPVLANDTDVDGPADITAVVNVSAVTRISGTGTATAVASGKLVNFTATAAGTYTFTYQAQDLGLLSSNTATATVVVAAAETVGISLAEFRVSAARLRVTGSVNPVTTPAQQIEIRWANGTDTVSVVATPVVGATGNWFVDIRGATGIQDPRNSAATRVVATSSTGGRSIAFFISIR